MGTIVLVLAALALMSCGGPTHTNEGCGPGTCAVAIRTRPAPAGPNEPCPLMGIRGVLAWDSVVGLGLRNDSGHVTAVEWPFRYTARRDATGVILFDDAGTQIAREGDVIEMTGWTDHDAGLTHPCDPPDLNVVTKA